MLSDVGQDVQIAGLGTEPATVSFFRDAHTRTGIDAGRDSDLNLLGLRRRSFAVAERARRPSPSGALAIRTRLRELKPSARSHDLARSFARRTRHDRPARIACALASCTLLCATH